MKSLVKYLLVLLFVCSFQPITAQESKSEVPYIEVQGKAERKVVPDRIFISVQLKEKTIGKKYLSLEEQEVKFDEILTRLNIDRAKVSLVSAMSDIIQRRDRDKGVVRTKTYQVEMSSAKGVSDLFAQLGANGIRETNIVRLDHTDIINIRKEVRIEAIKAAKDKAEYLTEAIGYSIGMPLIIRNTSATPYNTRAAVGANVAYFAESVDAIDLGVDFETITVTFSYYVKFEVK